MPLSREPDRLAAFALSLGLVLAAAGSRAAAADPPLSLEEVLQRARAANAALPIAASERAIAARGVDEARARLWPEASIEASGGPRAPADAFAEPSRLVAQLRLVFRESLYDGGRLRAQLAAARADYAAARAGYGVAAADLDFMVRVQFSEMVAARAEIVVRRRLLGRLRQYLDYLQARRASGQGVSGDLLKTEVRLRTQQADLIRAELRRDEARLALNDLMGRPPAAPLAIREPPAPAPPPAADHRPWLATPDLARARSRARSADARVGVARAGGRPHIGVEAGGGLINYAPNQLSGAADNITDGLGGSVIFSMSWSFWDVGLLRAQVRAAELEVDRARWQVTDTRRTVRLRWTRAATQLDSLWREIELWRETVPRARDSYLASESAYRGGSGTALDVLDAFDAWTSAAMSEIDAIQRYRVARAGYRRWGTR